MIVSERRRTTSGYSSAEVGSTSMATINLLLSPVNAYGWTRATLLRESFDVICCLREVVIGMKSGDGRGGGGGFSCVPSP